MVKGRNWNEGFAPAKKNSKEYRWNQWVDI